MQAASLVKGGAGQEMSVGSDDLIQRRDLITQSLV